MSKQEKTPEQIAAEDKAMAIIESCKMCDHFDNAEKYLELFNNQFNDEYTYNVLSHALKYRKESLNC